MGALSASEKSKIHQQSNSATAEPSGIQDGDDITRLKNNAGYVTSSGAKSAAPIQSVVSGANISIDVSDPANPVISAASSGDVVGPASAVDGHIALFYGTTGKLIKDGGALLSDKQDADADLTAIAAISTTGYLKRTGTNTWATVTSVPWGDLTGVPAYAIRWPSWSEVTSKPTFGSMANVNDAPSDGTGYVRKDGAWAAESGGAEPQPNLYDNPSGQLGTADWSPSPTASYATFSVAQKDEAPAFQFAVTATGGGTYYLADLYLPAEAGLTYSVSFDSLISSSVALAAWWRCVDESKAALTSTTFFGVSNASWGRAKIEGIATPTNTGFIHIRLYLTNPAVSDTFWVRRIKLERWATATPFSEDAYVDQKVNSQSVTNIVVTSTTPTSDPSKSGTLYLVF